jgi:hypothetical protein
MNESSRSKGVKNVLSLQAARERTRQAKAASDRQISKRSNQRLHERLEAENAQLRDYVVELMLELSSVARWCQIALAATWPISMMTL